MTNAHSGFKKVIPSALDFWLIVIGFVGCLTALLFFQARVFGANDGSRWDTVWSLTTGHGYVIDEAPYGTCDKVMKDGHFYSSKPALLPTLVAAMAYGLRPLCGDLGAQGGSLLMGVILWMLNVVPMAGLLCLYYNYLSAHGFSGFTANYCMLAAAFGTFLTAYAITLNNHVVAAYCAFAALYCFLQIMEKRNGHGRYFIACGLFSGLAAVNELHAGTLPVLLLIYLSQVSPRQTLLAALPGLVLVVAVSLAVSYAAYGSICPFYLMPQYYHYAGSYWDHTVGIDAIHETKPVYLLNILIGHHGIFSHSPIFVFSVLGLLIGRVGGALRRVAAICAMTTLLFITMATHNYGGVCQGPRWTFWLIPFGLFGLPWYIESRSDGRFLRLAAILALDVSALSVAFAALDVRGPWSTSWVHLVVRCLGLIDY